MARTSAPSIEQRTAALEQRVAVLESERPGRKPRPMLAIRQRDVCALDPSRDSTTCPDSSIYRYQSGCHGAACRLKQHNAYERRKNGKTPAKAVKVASPKKPPVKATKTANPKKAAPTKRTVPKKVAPSKQTTAPAKTVARRRITKAPAKRPSAA